MEVEAVLTGLALGVSTVAKLATAKAVMSGAAGMAASTNGVGLAAGGGFLAFAMTPVGMAVVGTVVVLVAGEAFLALH